MKVVAMSEFRARMGTYLGLVKQGEEIVLTERGKPVAKVIPLDAEAIHDAHIQDLINRGFIRPGKPISKEWIDNLPICIVPDGTIQRLIDEERDERYF